MVNIFMSCFYKNETNTATYFSDCQFVSKALNGYGRITDSFSILTISQRTRAISKQFFLSKDSAIILYKTGY
jgi:hypothetical protein